MAPASSTIGPLRVSVTDILSQRRVGRSKHAVGKLLVLAARQSDVPGSPSASSGDGGSCRADTRTAGGRPLARGGPACETHRRRATRLRVRKQLRRAPAPRPSPSCRRPQRSPRCPACPPQGAAATFDERHRRHGPGVEPQRIDASTARHHRPVVESRRPPLRPDARAHGPRAAGPARPPGRPVGSCPQLIANAGLPSATGSERATRSSSKSTIDMAGNPIGQQCGGVGRFGRTSVSGRRQPRPGLVVV